MKKVRIFMPVYKSFTELMALARRQMSGKLATLIGAMLLQELIILSANSVGILLFPETDLISNILYFVISFIIQLFAGILQVGATLLYLHTACGMPCRISDLFYAFRHSPDKAIKVQFIFALLNAICMLPSNIILWTATDTMNYNILLATSIATLIGTLIYLLITLPIFPMFYLLLDFPQLTVRALFQKSLKIMKGNCIRYLLLQLCFLPLMFLSIFTCGIALIWVIPFMNVTCTNFYLDIMAYRNKTFCESAS